MSAQTQFLDVIDRDEAERRFHGAIELKPLGEESVAVADALGRTLARDVVASVDVPSFDRSNYDGYAVQASDTFGATEQTPRHLVLLPEVVATAIVPTHEVAAGRAITIATGGMLPRGADAIVMVEHADGDSGELVVRRSVTPGFGVSYAGTDISAGETVLPRGTVLTSRETGVLAAIGASRIEVWRQPKVAIISTGDEIIAPTQTMRPGMVFDSNARIIADAVRELGARPVEMGIVQDDLTHLRERVNEARQSCDVILLSGGTSKGAGDLSYRVVSDLDDPGIVAHGVALKPGKPICLAASCHKPIVVLPGFPTSAIFTFHEFVAPVIAALAGRPQARPATATAQMAVRINSEIGRTEYLLVGLVASSLDRGESDMVAYPMGQGSGSVTTFSRADGFVTIDRHQEIVEARQTVTVQLLGRGLEVADLIVIGSHCVGLDYLLGQLQDRGFRTKFLAVGSTAGLDAVRRGECDLAGIHLLDARTGEYNRPFLSPDMDLVPGYGRQQGVLFRRGDERFEGLAARDAVAGAKQNSNCMMVNRNKGSGTRILIDELLEGDVPNGYAIQSKNHNAVAAAVLQSRADWGVAIKTVADRTGLGFLPLTEERYDFVSPKSRSAGPAVMAVCDLLNDRCVRAHLVGLGFRFA